MSFLGWVNTQDDNTKNFFATAAKWVKDYPTLAKQFKRHPEVLNIMITGAQLGWRQEQIEDHLAGTSYYRKTTEAQRDMDVMAVFKPAEYQKVAEAKMVTMRKTVSRLGLYIKHGSKAIATHNFLTDMAAIVNNAMTDDQITDYLLSKYSPKSAGDATGEIRNSMNDIRSLARDYAYKIDDATVLKYGIAIQTGGETLDSVKGQLSKQARRLFNNPELVKAIDDGLTVREWADPYVQIAATTLEVGADTIDLSQDKWQKFLMVPKADKGAAYGVNYRTMTLSEWQATLRTDKSYGFDKTENARESAVDMSEAIQQKFGVIG